MKRLQGLYFVPATIDSVSSGASLSRHPLHDISKMGFLKSCVDTLLSLATFNIYNPYDISTQKPLLSSSDNDGSGQAPIASPPGTVSFEPHSATAGFKCTYPSRWKPCNTETSRDCWLQDTESPNEFGAYSQVDIHTDCEYLHFGTRGSARERMR